MTLEDREVEALDWVRRIHDPNFHDWDAHLAWLEGDPENTRAFDRMLSMAESADVALAATVRVEPHANDNPAHVVDIVVAQPSRIAVRGRSLLAMAAAVVAVVGVTTFVTQPPAQPQLAAFSTPPGVHRTLRLGDGTRIAMNGGSTIRVASDGRRVTLDQGEVFLDVVHDERRPFELEAGDIVLRDVGTAFNVVQADDRFGVQVREGMVDYLAQGETMRLGAGQTLTRTGGRVVVGRGDAGAIGGWRSGTLVYRDAALAEVAADVARAIGEPVTVDASAARTRFTGVIAVDRDHERMFRRFSAVANVRARRSGGHWRITAIGI